MTLPSSAGVRPQMVVNGATHLSEIVWLVVALLLLLFLALHLTTLRRCSTLFISGSKSKYHGNYEMRKGILGQENLHMRSNCWSEIFDIHNGYRKGYILSMYFCIPRTTERWASS